jgi:hypothetical protein
MVVGAASHTGEHQVAGRIGAEVKVGNRSVRFGHREILLPYALGCRGYTAPCGLDSLLFAERFGIARCGYFKNSAEFPRELRTDLWQRQVNEP